jgi:hypothetical protein
MWLYKVLFIHPEQNTHNIFIVIALHFCILFVSFCAHRTCETMPLKPRPVATPARVGERSSLGGAHLYATTLFYVCVQELLHCSYCIELNIFTILRIESTQLKQMLLVTDILRQLLSLNKTDLVDHVAI